MKLRTRILAGLPFAAALAIGQEAADGRPRGAALRLVPSEPLAALRAKPADRAWRTYAEPRVARFDTDQEGIAIHGYDVLSYREGRAERGRKELSADYAGVTWLFADAEHRKQFLAAPDAYRPEYGGFCAYSVANGSPATADPHVYTVEDGKLYLFFDKAVQLVWKQDRSRLAREADRRWPER